MVFAPIPPVSPITSITNRPLCIYVIYFSTLITSSRRRVTEGDSFKTSVAVASTFQITDCICPADLISLQSPCRADQKPFKDLFMKRYLTYSISPAVALACQLHWMMADQTTAVEAIALKKNVHRHLCLHLYFTRTVSVKILPNATPRFWYLNLTSALWAINKISAQKHSQFIILVWAG